MPIQFPCRHPAAHKRAECANLCYQITLLPSGELRVHNIKSHGGTLALTPGAVTDDSGLDCGGCISAITIPPCRSYAAAWQSVPVEPPCREICGESSNSQAGCSFPCECIRTSTTKQASVRTVRSGGSVTYTITFTNHASIVLDMVSISDDIPSGADVVPGSIHPAPGPGETLQTGISMGELAPGQSAVLTYTVTAHFGTSCQIVNCACARYRYTDCRGCRQWGAGSCRSCVVTQSPDDAKLKITKCANKNYVCSRWEEIEYTLIVSNPGKAVLTEVSLCDNIPQGLCYKPGSTVKNGGAPTDENPQDGIPIGTLRPGEDACVTFVLYVCNEICPGHLPVKFVNTANASGRACKLKLCAESNPWTVTLEQCSLCQWVQRQFPICGFRCCKNCFVYHRGVDLFKTSCGRILVVRFGILINYIDCAGETRSKSFEDSTVFCMPPECFLPPCFTVHFAEFFCDIDCSGNAAVCFQARLCPSLDASPCIPSAPQSE